MRKYIENIITFIAAAFLIWLVASFIDVNAHNLTDQAYSWWNVFFYL